MHRTTRPVVQPRIIFFVYKAKNLGRGVRYTVRFFGWEGRERLEKKYMAGVQVQGQSRHFRPHVVPPLGYTTGPDTRVWGPSALLFSELPLEKVRETARVEQRARDPGRAPSAPAIEDPVPDSGDTRSRSGHDPLCTRIAPASLAVGVE